MSDTLFPTQPLAELTVFSAQGPDAGTFLQGQLTQDVLSMTPLQARAGGYCSAKGRLLGNFVILHPAADAYWFITPSSVAESLVKRLKMFVLRARCTLQIRDDLQVWGHWGGTLTPWSVQAGESEGPGWRIGWWAGRFLELRSRTEAPRPTLPEALDAWRRADIEAGWPWIEAATVDQFVPQMINFEVLGGVNFRKGCYPGQEVVARSQYRGTLKRRMAAFDCELGGGASGAVHAAAVPAPATEIFHSEDPGQPAGQVVQAAPPGVACSKVTLLAEVKLAALQSGSLHLGSPEGPTLSPRVLPYRIPTEAEM